MEKKDTDTYSITKTQWVVSSQTGICSCIDQNKLRLATRTLKKNISSNVKLTVTRGDLRQFLGFSRITSFNLQFYAW